MKRNRRLLSVLFCTIAAILGSLLAATPARATSIYDSAVQTVPALVSHSSVCDTVDLSHSWYGALNHNMMNRSYHSTMMASLNEALDNGSYAIIQPNIELDSPLIAQVIWTNNPNAFTVWDASGIYDRVPSSADSDLRINKAWIEFRYYNGGSSCDYGLSWADGKYDGTTFTNDPSYGEWVSYPGQAHLFFSTFPVTYPSGYEGELIPSAMPHAAYVAMGDSFSSGEGNSPFEPGSDESGVNKCHRSPNAYPRLLQADPNLNLGSTAFVACSGATMTSVTSGNSGGGNWDEGPQTDALSDDTEVVTITIGGNDVGFQEYLTICLAHIASCAPGSATYDAVMDIIDSTAFLINLESVYEEILDKAPNANVYVVDYPHLTTYNTEYCGLLDLSGGFGIQTALNSAIKTATIDVRFADPDYYDRLHYVDTNAVGSPFEHKQICDGMSSDFGFTTFHPNIQGHIDYALVVASEIS